MRFQIRKASDFDRKEVREMGTLEELLQLLKEFKHDIVVGPAFSIGEQDHDYRVTIYDDYME